jgi:hypothetical protein
MCVYVRMSVFVREDICMCVCVWAAFRHHTKKCPLHLYVHVCVRECMCACADHFQSYEVKCCVCMCVLAWPLSRNGLAGNWLWLVCAPETSLQNSQLALTCAWCIGRKYFDRLPAAIISGIILLFSHLKAMKSFLSKQGILNHEIAWTMQAFSAFT